MIAALLITGLTAAGATFVVRAIVDELRPALLLHKPFSCDLCMNWWSSLVAALVIDHAASFGECAHLVLGGTAIGVVVTKVANRLSD
jgi:hypothetical protein